MERIENLEELKQSLGKTFKDTLIYDPVLGPYFIVHYSDGGWAVMKARTRESGEITWMVEGYPTSFERCLSKIAKKLVNAEGQVYETLQSYLEAWTKISNTIRDAFKQFD